MKINSKQIKLIIAFACMLFHAGVFAQTKPLHVNPPDINDFAPIQSFLASEGLEGRETGTRGAAIAADYIASVMQNSGLKPYKSADISKTQLSDSFQPFTLIRYKKKKS